MLVAGVVLSLCASTLRIFKPFNLSFPLKLANFASGGPKMAIFSLFGEKFEHFFILIGFPIIGKLYFSWSKTSILGEIANKQGF